VYISALSCAGYIVVGDNQWLILLQVPSCFGASSSGDHMYLAGRVVCVGIWLVDTHFSTSFVIEVGLSGAKVRISARMNFGVPVESMNALERILCMSVFRSLGFGWVCSQ
jgi:hypothetical protein